LPLVRLHVLEIALLLELVVFHLQSAQHSVLAVVLEVVALTRVLNLVVQEAVAVALLVVLGLLVKVVLVVLGLERRLVAVEAGLLLLAVTLLVPLVVTAVLVSLAVLTELQPHTVAVAVEAATQVAVLAVLAALVVAVTVALVVVVLLPWLEQTTRAAEAAVPQQILAQARPVLLVVLSVPSRLDLWLDSPLQVEQLLRLRVTALSA
jgi:hypothetical protein